MVGTKQGEITVTTDNDKEQKRLRKNEVNRRSYHKITAEQKAKAELKEQQRLKNNEYNRKSRAKRKAEREAAAKKMSSNTPSSTTSTPEKKMSSNSSSSTPTTPPTKGGDILDTCWWELTKTVSKAQERGEEVQPAVPSMAESLSTAIAAKAQSRSTAIAAKENTKAAKENAKAEKYKAEAAEQTAIGNMHLLLTEGEKQKTEKAKAETQRAEMKKLDSARELYRELSSRKLPPKSDRLTNDMEGMVESCVGGNSPVASPKMVHADKVSDKKPTASASRFGRKTASGATAKSSFYNPLDRTKKDEVGKAVTFKKSLFDDTKPKTKEELEEDRLTELRLDGEDEEEGEEFKNDEEADENVMPMVGITLKNPPPSPSIKPIDIKDYSSPRSACRAARKQAADRRTQSAAKKQAAALRTQSILEKGSSTRGLQGTPSRPHSMIPPTSKSKSARTKTALPKGTGQHVERTSGSTSKLPKGTGKHVERNLKARLEKSSSTPSKTVSSYMASTSSSSSKRKITKTSSPSYKKAKTEDPQDDKHPKTPRGNMTKPKATTQKQTTTGTRRSARNVSKNRPNY